MSVIAGIIDREEREAPGCIEQMLRMMTHRTKGKYHLFRTRTIQIAGRAELEETLYIRHKIIAVIDGELHHPDKLKQALKEKGHVLLDDSAEGLLTLAYLEWGEECLKKVQGDFTCAIYDIERNLLILARDPLAKRPLYWFKDEEHFLFASEMKALMATRYIPSHVCVDGLAAYFALGYYPLEMTPLRGMYKLLPGYFLRIGAQWAPTTHYYGPSLHELEDESVRISHTFSLQEVLQANFKKQQEECYSAGCILSGGLGSAFLAHSLTTSRLFDQRIHACVIRWEELGLQMTLPLQQMAQDLSIPCDVVTLGPASMLQDMLSMVWYLDEPVINMEVWSMWKVARMGSASTEALYFSYGVDHLLPYALERQRLVRAQSGWQGVFQSLKCATKGHIAAYMQLFSQKMRLKWTKHCDVAPQELQSFCNSWADYTLLNAAAPQLVSHFDPCLFVLQTHCTKGTTMFLDPYIHLYCITQIFSAINQPAERLASAFGLKCQTPYMEHNMILLLGGLYKQNIALLTTELYQSLQHALSAERLSALKAAPRIKLPPWSDHPGFIQAFETMREGVLVRSGWVLRSWLNEALINPKLRKDSFGFLLAMLQWEMWYKLFVEETPHEHPSPLSAIQFLHR